MPLHGAGLRAEPLLKQCIYSCPMRHLSHFSRPTARRGDGEPRPVFRRRLLAAPILLVLAAGAMMVAPAVAGADTSSTLTVVGTSDLSDSGLSPNLIQP